MVVAFAVGIVACALMSATAQEPLASDDVIAAMEYKGIQYSVLRTANPTGFKWTVELPNGRTRTGDSRSRPSAIRLAITTIDRALQASTKMTRHG